MTEQQPPQGEYRLYPKGPNFGLIVALSALALIILFIVFYFFGAHGRHMLPRTHRRRDEPRSQLIMPAPSASRIKV